MITKEAELLTILRDSLLPGQEGITLRAFMAFNRNNPLVRMENLENLRIQGYIEIKDDTLYPLEIL